MLRHITKDKMWKVPVFGLLSLLIIGFIGIIWGGLIITNARTTPTIPWAFPIMAGVLFLMWKYLGGKGWPRGTSEARKQLLRANRVSGQAVLWSLLAGVPAIIALTAYWIIAFQLFKMPANLFLPNFVGYPALTIAVIAMGSLVSPITEESSVRGYFQVILERRFRPFTVIMISSVVFALAHVNQGLQLPKLSVYFLAGVVFGSIALLNDSILPGILVHIMADLTFFILIWPHDAGRKLVWQTGADFWFWTHVAQAIVFTILSVMAFRRLYRITRAVQVDVPNAVQVLASGPRMATSQGAQL